MDMKTLGIDRLSVEERIALMGEIWDSIVPEPAGSGFSAAERVEIDLALAEYAANPDDVIPWEVARDEIRNELRAMT